MRKGLDLGSYLWFECDDFEQHLNCEEASEDHIEDIHGIVEGSSLLIMLGEKVMCEYTCIRDLLYHPYSDLD